MQFCAMQSWLWFYGSVRCMRASVCHQTGGEIKESEHSVLSACPAMLLSSARPHFLAGQAQQLNFCLAVAVEDLQTVSCLLRLLGLASRSREEWGPPPWRDDHGKRLHFFLSLWTTPAPLSFLCVQVAREAGAVPLAGPAH